MGGALLGFDNTMATFVDKSPSNLFGGISTFILDNFSGILIFLLDNLKKCSF
jgi:hypothetical protein